MGLWAGEGPREDGRTFPQGDHSHKRPSLQINLNQVVPSTTLDTVGIESCSPSLSAPPYGTCHMSLENWAGDKDASEAKPILLISVLFYEFH